MHVAVDDNESEGLARGIAAEMRGPTRRGGEGRIGVQNRNERESGVESCKVRCKGAGMRTKREMETGKKVKEHRTTAGPRSSETECEAGRAQTLWGLPPNARLSYLAEGGANIVYRVSLSNHESSRDGEAYGVEGSDKTVRPVRTRRDQQSKNTNQNSKPRESSSQSSSPSQSSSRMLNTLLLRNRLLRLRKGTPAARSYVEILAHFDAYIRPLFGAHEVVDQALVLLPPGLTAGLNRQLREREAGAEAEARMQTATAMDKTRNERNEKNAESIEARPRGRRGVYLAEDEPFGLLITDMTPAAAASVADPGAGTGEWQQMWEFKPKWLVQSPSAPRDARRCRTCALRAMKRHDAAMAAATATCGVECQIGNTDERRKKAEEIGKDKDSFLSSALSSAHAFCPLDLVSDKFDDVLRAARCVVAGQQQHHALHHHPLHHHAGCRPLNDSSGDSAVWLARLLHRHPTLTTLRARQQQFDAVGLGGADAALEERAVAMALRDCTMYVRVRDQQHPADIRLGDMDFKPGAGGKLRYWQTVETRLIHEGWYAGRTGQHDTDDCECALYRGALQPGREGKKLVTTQGRRGLGGCEINGLLRLDYTASSQLPSKLARVVAIKRGGFSPGKAPPPTFSFQLVHCSFLSSTPSTIMTTPPAAANFQPAAAAFQNLIRQRRSVRQVEPKSPIPDKDIVELVNSTILHTPSAFNTQTTRTVVLLHDAHREAWQSAISKLEGAAAAGTEPWTKIAGGILPKLGWFKGAYGTVLFYEDAPQVKELQGKFAAVADQFPTWSKETNAMHQYSLWLSLRSVGISASLQHYQALLNEHVQKTLGIPEGWELHAQLVFGTHPDTEDPPKEAKPLEDRVKVFGAKF